jgi:hypothetical protein
VGQVLFGATFRDPWHITHETAKTPTAQNTDRGRTGASPKARHRPGARGRDSHEKREQPRLVACMFPSKKRTMFTIYTTTGETALKKQCSHAPSWI